MSDNDSKDYKNPDKRPDISSKRNFPVALFVWLIVFAAAAGLFIFASQRKQFDDWNQSKFEENLGKGLIKTANLTPKGDQVVLIEGKYVEGKMDGLPLPPDSSVANQPRYYQVEVLYTDNFDKKLLESKVEKKVDNKDTWFRNILTTMLLIVIPVGLLYVLFSRQIKLASKGAMQFGKSKARMILPDTNKTKFDDVAGADEAKEETKEVIDYLKDPLKFKMLGGRIPKGVLLMGPPGTGKTLLAKAIAGEADVPFFSISGSDFVEMFVGVGASRVRDMFEQARRHSPCLIFIDEIDAVGRSRFSGIGGGHDEREQTLNALLVEMDGLETQEGVLIIAATNRPDVLDPALLRPGRFDRHVVLDLPDIKGRRQILNIHIKNIKVDPDVNLDVIARGTPGFSGADLANLVNEAALLAARLDKKAAAMVDMEEARDKVRWGRERRSRVISERERRLTAYHEAGHAIVSLHCKSSSPIHKVTIVPRGVAYLGATMSLPKEDKYTQARSELEDDLTVLMGGRIAEELVFGEITSGAAGDIGQATKIVRRMICSFGMSDKLGSLAYGSRDEHIYIGRDIVKTEDYSEATAREIDIEMKRLVDTAQQKAKTILTEARDKLELLAKKLLDVETLDAKDIRILLNMPEETETSAAV